MYICWSVLTYRKSYILEECYVLKERKQGILYLGVWFVKKQNTGNGQRKNWMRAQHSSSQYFSLAAFLKILKQPNDRNTLKCGKLTESNSCFKSYVHPS